jgi:hypothetical protein
MNDGIYKCAAPGPRVVRVLLIEMPRAKSKIKLRVPLSSREWD